MLRIRDKIAKMTFKNFSTKIMYQVYDFLNRRSILRLYNNYMNNQFKKPEHIDKLHFKSMKKLVIYSYKNVPYYKRIFDNVGIKPSDIKTKKDLLKIPILTKKDINENFDDLISKKVNKKNLIISQSGGSTGETTRFIIDTKVLDSHKAAEMRFFDYMGLKVGEKTIRLWATIDMLSLLERIKLKIFETLNNRILFDGFNLKEENIRNIIKKIQKFKPKLAIGYTPAIDLLAKYAKKHKIKNLGIKSIFTTGSVLYPEMRKRIEDSLECEVYNEYGSREVGPAAHECAEHNGLHINAELAYLEFIKDNRIAKPEEEADIIITTLTNLSMPLIRYKLGDVGSYTNRKCKCGRGLPLINNPTGRTLGVFTALDGNKVNGYYFISCVFLPMKNVKQFQLIQLTKKDYTLRLVKNPGFGKQDKILIDKKLRDKLGKNITIKYKFEKEIKPEKSGKYLFTKSLIK